MKNFIKIGNKSYSYFFEVSNNSDIVHFKCKEANIDQDFLKEDIVDLIEDLPNLIESEHLYKEKKDQVIRFRVSGLDKIKIQERSNKEGYKNISSYIKDKLLI